MKIVTAILNKSKPLISTLSSIKNQSQKSDVFLFSKIKTNLDVNTVTCSPIDNMYYKALEFGLKQGYDFIYMIENNSVLNSNCLESKINYMNKFVGLNKHVNYICCYCDFFFNSMSREYLSSLNDNTVNKIPIVLDNLLINLNAIKEKNIPNLKSLKNNKEYVITTLSYGIPLHIPESLYITEFRKPSTLVQTDVI